MWNSKGIDGDQQTVFQIDRTVASVFVWVLEGSNAMTGQDPDR